MKKKRFLSSVAAIVLAVTATVGAAPAGSARGFELLITASADRAENVIPEARTTPKVYSYQSKGIKGNYGVSYNFMYDDSMMFTDIIGQYDMTFIFVVSYKSFPILAEFKRFGSEFFSVIFLCLLFLTCIVFLFSKT